MTRPILNQVRRTVPSDCFTYNAAGSAIQAEHIHVYPSELRGEEWSDTGRCRNVSLENVRENLQVIGAGQYVHADSCLFHEIIPLK